MLAILAAFINMTAAALLNIENQCYFYSYSLFLIFQQSGTGSIFLIGGDYVGAGPFSSAVYQSQPGLLCDYQGMCITVMNFVFFCDLYYLY